MKLHEILDPVAAAKEMEDLNAQMVAVTGEYRAKRTPEALKKITDLNDKMQRILAARGRMYSAIHEVLDTKADLEQIEDNSKMTQWVLRTGNATIIFELRWFGSKRESCELYFKDTDSGYNLNGKGNELKIFAACKQILEWAIKEHDPYVISFEADKSEGSVRDQLYRRMLKRWTPPGYSFSEVGDSRSANFTLKKKKDAVNEGVEMTPYRAKSEIRKIAYELKIASNQLMNFYKKRLDRIKDKAKSLRVTERDLNVKEGTLKGFDTLYDIATSA